MHTPSIYYLIPLWLVLPFAGWLVARLWSERDRSDVKVLLAFILSSSAWSVLYSLELIVVEENQKLAFAAAQYPFIASLTLTWFLFSTSMLESKNRVSLRMFLLLCVVPAITIICLLLPSTRGLIWKSHRLVEEGPFLLLDVDYGTLFWLFNIHSLLLVVLGILALHSVAAFSKRISLSVRTALIFTPLLPAVCNVAYTLGHSPIEALDFTPFTFLPAAATFTYVVVGHKFHNVAALGRDTVFDALQQAVVSLDRDSVVVDANAKALQMMNVSLKSAVGREITELMPSLLSDKLWSRLQSSGLVELHSAEEMQYIRYELKDIERGQNSEAPGKILSVTDITEQRTAQLEVTSAHEKAKASNRAKARFLANMSQELRTPMNGIIGTIQLLLQENRNNPLTAKVKSGFDSIAQSTEAMIGVLNSMLDIANIEAENLEIVHAEFSLRDLVRRVHDLFSGNASNHGVQLVCTVDDHCPDLLIGDEARIQHILSNIVGNAVKYTDDGQVVISVSVEDKEGHRQLCFEVSDTGVGMTRQQVSRVFQENAQDSETGTKLYERSGLGLAIVHELVKLMEGTVTIDSVLGEGTSLSIRLPLQIADENKELHKNAWQQGAAGNGPAQLSRVLLAEDDALTLELTKSLLERHSVEVTTAQNGLQVVEYAQRSSFDLILLGMHLTKLDASGATQQIRALPSGADTPIVALVSDMKGEDDDSLVAMGMNGFLKKPLSMTDIQSVLAAYCGLERIESASLH